MDVRFTVYGCGGIFLSVLLVNPALWPVEGSWQRTFDTPLAFSQFFDLLQWERHNGAPFDLDS